MAVRQPRVLCVTFGKTIEAVIDGLFRQEGIVRDILIYGHHLKHTDQCRANGEGKRLGLPKQIATSFSYVPLPERSPKKVLKNPTVDEIVAAIDEYKPTAIIFHGGLESGEDDRPGSERLKSLPSSMLGGQNRIIASMLAARPEIVYIDSFGCSELAERIRKKTAAFVVAWSDLNQPNVFVAYHFLYSFFGILEMKSVVAAEAFAIAAELTCAFVSNMEASDPREPIALPRMFGDEMPRLPGIGYAPSFVDKTTGETLTDPQNYYPGYLDMRLCAPNAEVRVLVSALYDIMSAARLGSLCQGIRGILAAEIRESKLVRKTQINIDPPYLPGGSVAYRCSMKSLNDISFDVVVGGPPGVLTNDDLVEHGLRQAMIADVHSLQFKIPPPGQEIPDHHSSEVIASGAPMIEVLVVTSSWIVYVMKRICENPLYRPLVIGGIGAVSTSVNISFSKEEAIRQAATVTGGDLDKARLNRGVVTSNMLLGAYMQVRSHPAEAVQTPALPPFNTGIEGSPKAMQS